jgi:replicative DNA helicase
MSVSRERRQPIPKSAETILGKRLPASLDAERSVIGAILLNDELAHSVSELLRSGDFYSIAHKEIYQTILKIIHSQKRVDLLTVQDELSKSDTLESVGGISYLMSLQEDIPAMGMIEQHAAIIKEKAVLRELIESATGIISNCYSQDHKSIEAVLDQAEKTIFEISNKKSNQSFIQLDIWLRKTFQHLSDIKGNSKGLTGVPTGYKKLNDMTSGFQKGDLLILAARPSMGKTSIALCMAEHAAQSGAAVGFLSLEMSAEQITLRLLSSESGIPHQFIRNATISSQEWVELTNVAAQLAEMKLFIDDSPMVTILDVRTKARKLKAEHALDFLVIDYLQLIHGSRKHESRHMEVSEISRSLKALAKELNIPILALSQLSRAVDSRMDKRPMLSDLRESGAIEQDADLIMFLYRDIVYNPEAENPALSELIIGKQRNGPTGTVYLDFVRELTKFEDNQYEQ